MSEQNEAGFLSMLRRLFASCFKGSETQHSRQHDEDAGNIQPDTSRRPTTSAVVDQYYSGQYQRQPQPQPKLIRTPVNRPQTQQQPARQPSAAITTETSRRQNYTVNDSINSNYTINNYNSIQSQQLQLPQPLIPTPSTATQRLTVTCSPDDSATRLTATVCWTYQGGYGGYGATHDSWQVTVVNLTWSQGDNCTYQTKKFTLHQGDRSYKLSLWLRPGNRYKVTVSGMKRNSGARSYSTSSVGQLNSVLFEGSAEFRAGTMLSKSDVERLYHNAQEFVRQRSKGRRTQCTWLHRNKPREHFDKIIRENYGRMKKHLKDASGDQRSPINGEISGLFFLANAQSNGQPLPKSPFGDTRLLVEAHQMLAMAQNVYFADFYCMNTDGPHYVVLVLTRSCSEADNFCMQHLPRLDFDNETTNPFLFQKSGVVYTYGNYSCLIEVFFTEEIADIRSHQIAYNIPIVKKGTSTQGGIRKFSNCVTCDLFSGRSFGRNVNKWERF